METIIEAMHLNKAYNDQVTALLDVNFAIGKGEFVALLGRSGSGKSTLLNILGGLDAPTSGEVRIDGRNVDFGDRKALIALRREAIGFIFQSFNLIPALTAQENVEYPLLFNYHEKAARRERAADLLATVGLADRAHHYPREMSGGEQQRVAIARALVGDPLIVLADEPTGNLDSRTRDEIFDLMRRVNRERETTFLIVTHERELGKRTDRTIELLDGSVVS
ncbi:MULTISPECIES: ABC transporter ATP-binding protein [unclassified Methanoculleus]|jgi:putative ABC transport system ATP-binding protein|uniref:ABC transporter ATP-binding protein n=2 Tax=Methanoculleus TaxID=45989 RepID=UPI0025DDF0B4|nr:MULTISPECIES: ABC transporter ATP-binding protein [unclassified Methanoculleus]MCE5337237.1 ABC transporter ATP-binding protein [Methanomicrobiaceae archaeon]MCK9317754.1 ABC transporter ATP-binding protein [Methanoculleus sp.]MDD2788817.1 ABC transporter ATP-binding protein [Methanoculleus sp.]MDD3216851.1 ABC transporter ATP-binding protein [Methanoculleus sp.]MDD4315499.1 ABC transporter ATP-binding protein [Methanoculleus sp.]